MHLAAADAQTTLAAALTPAQPHHATVVGMILHAVGLKARLGPRERGTYGTSECAYYGAATARRRVSTGADLRSAIHERRSAVKPWFRQHKILRAVYLIGPRHGARGFAGAATCTPWQARGLRADGRRRVPRRTVWRPGADLHTHPLRGLTGRRLSLLSRLSGRHRPRAHTRGAAQLSYSCWPPRFRGRPHDYGPVRAALFTDRSRTLTPTAHTRPPRRPDHSEFRLARLRTHLAAGRRRPGRTFARPQRSLFHVVDSFTLTRVTYLA